LSEGGFDSTTPCGGGIVGGGGPAIKPCCNGRSTGRCGNSAGNHYADKTRSPEGAFRQAAMVGGGGGEGEGGGAKDKDNCYYIHLNKLRERHSTIASSAVMNQQNQQQPQPLQQLQRAAGGGPGVHTSQVINDVRQTVVL